MPARELAQRSTGADEVLLLWHPDSERVELSVHNFTTGASFHLEVEPGNAMDAFYHPYAYIARCGDADHSRAEGATVDG